MYLINISELGNLKPFTQFKFATAERSKSPDLLKSKPLAQVKFRRSKSEMDIRSEVKTTVAGKAGAKRFFPVLETIPNKRLKAGPVTSSSLMSSRPLQIRTQEKKAAIINSIKTSTLCSTTTVKKPPLAKSTSGPIIVGTKLLATTKSAAIKNNTAARPAPYDYKARFNLLNEKHTKIKSDNAQLKEENGQLSEKNDLLEHNEKVLQDKLIDLERQLQQAEQSNAELLKRIQLLETTNSQLNLKNTSLAASLSDTSDELGDLKTQHSELKTQHLELKAKHEKLQAKSGSLEQNYNEASSKLSEARDQLYTINIERKVLHNVVLDLRGNIRVFCRVRPPTETERDRVPCSWQFNDESSLEIVSNELVPSGGRKQTRHEFSFDQVFNPNSLQSEIFEMVSPLVQSALDGYNVCIFAYGQTGSGE